MKLRRLTMIVAACANGGGPKQIGGSLLGGGLGALADRQMSRPSSGQDTP